MRFLLLIFLFYIFHRVNGQDSSDVIGRWKVAVTDNGVRYDYKTNTYTVSKALRDSLDKWKSSLFNLDDYITWAGSCSNCYFVFKPNGFYQELREAEVRTEGSFQVIPTSSIIKINAKVNDRTVSKKYEYRFVGRRLVLKIPSFFLKENQRIKLELERSN